MHITILGGSGFVGLAICESLVTAGHRVTSVSRHGKPSHLKTPWANEVVWLRSDVLADDNWQDSVQKSEWVIDTIGILFEKPQQGLTYQRMIIKPVERLIDHIEASKSSVKILFISANKGPFILKKYLSAKKEAESLIKSHDDQHVIFYPSLVSGKGRGSDTIASKLIWMLKKLPVFKRLLRGFDPMSKEMLANEIRSVVEGQSSIYTERR